MVLYMKRDFPVLFRIWSRKHVRLISTRLQFLDIQLKHLAYPLVIRILDHLLSLVSEHTYLLMHVQTKIILDDNF